jgi:hypothetical protein
MGPGRFGGAGGASLGCSSSPPTNRGSLWRYVWPVCRVERSRTSSGDKEAVSFAGCFGG